MPVTRQSNGLCYDSIDGLCRSCIHDKAVNSEMKNHAVTGQHSKAVDQLNLSLFECPEDS